MTEEVPVKSASQLKKEAAKKAKLEKFQKKQEALKAQKAAAEAKKVTQPVKSAEVTKPTVTEYVFKHPVGHKKDVSGEMPSSYSPKYVEAAWYEWWESSGFFKPEYGRDLTQKNPKGTFTIMIPPPNVTGVLHIGHALTNAIEDAVVRRSRMMGKTALWVPGCDHAGIATQVVVEKKLKNERNISRHDIGRESFNAEAMKWKEDKQKTIYHQLRKMGGSYDWDRACFTMDPKMCKAVTEAFVRMHDKGLIFRSNRLINWSCTLKSCISDIEVDKVEIKGRTMFKVPGYAEPVEVGILEEFQYQVVGSDDRITVATTRLETMLGDTAVAVHPEDGRYTHLHGKSVFHPFRKCEMPIVTDVFVDKEFGTGAVKITPAHDFNDYDVGIRNKLPFIECINDDGLITNVVPMFAGMRRFDARIAVRCALEELGYYVELKPHDMVVPVCQRSKDIVEPLLKPQWFVNCKEMASKAVEKVKSGELKIVPKNFEKTWYSWLDDCRDWCVSRQLWWGHRIPAYKVTVGNAPSDDLDGNYWVSGHSAWEARQKAATRFKVSLSEIKLEQDPDVLDTWFSSGLFPFSVFGWPDSSVDLKTFYPGTLLETGHDILFFWVARMVMMGLELMDDLPFTEVFLHPMIRDAQGIKMSKSLGNVVDPLDVVNGITLNELHDKIDNGYLQQKELVRAREGQKRLYPRGIPECGTDAMRFALCSYLTQARDLNLDVLRVEGYRKFCNKMWNASKFAFMQLGPDYKPPSMDIMATPGGLGTESEVDKWILHRANVAINETNQGFSDYLFQHCTTAIYSFWLYDFCDVYLESTKRVFYKGDEKEREAARSTLYTCLDIGLRLIHPFMPYISEELWQRLGRRAEADPPSLVVSPYPESGAWLNDSIDNNMKFIRNIIHTARSVKDAYLDTKAKPEVYLLSDETALLKPYLNCIEDLIGCSKLHLNVNPPIGTAVGAVGNRCEAHVLVKGLVNPQEEIERLSDKKDNVEKQVSQLQDKMEKYTEKVPESVKEASRDKLAALQGEVKTIDVAIENFKKLMA